MALDHSFGSATLRREDVTWPGDGDGVRSWFDNLHVRWEGELGRLTDDMLLSTERARWPLTRRPFADVIAWVNLELMKNAAEIGYARFLYAARACQTSV